LAKYIPTPMHAVIINITFASMGMDLMFDFILGVVISFEVL